MEGDGKLRKSHLRYALPKSIVEEEAQASTWSIRLMASLYSLALLNSSAKISTCGKIRLGAEARLVRWNYEGRDSRAGVPS
jgi:hypothetical protein